jgi:hypothetical protein
MQKKGGDYGDHDIAWFNGGLFEVIDVPAARPPTDPRHPAPRRRRHGLARHRPHHLRHPLRARPRPAARAPLGAHYTDTGTIAKLIDPLVANRSPPNGKSAKAARRRHRATAPKARKAKPPAPPSKLPAALNHYRVLDPACGSGNFLYLALKALRDIEKRAHVDAQELGLQPN